MPPVNQPPIGLTDQEILCVIAALQTLGGTPTVTLKTTHKYSGGAEAAAPRRCRRPQRPGARSCDRAILQPVALASGGGATGAARRIR